MSPATELATETENKINTSSEAIRLDVPTRPSRFRSARYKSL